MYSYKVAYQVLNSQNFSVAQSRERLIYIAVRNDVIKEKKIVPKQIFAQIEERCKENRQYLLQDALSDIKTLDAPRVKNVNEIDSNTTGKKIDINPPEANLVDLNGSIEEKSISDLSPLLNRPVPIYAPDTNKALFNFK